jgi:hypothetical protein
MKIATKKRDPMPIALYCSPGFGHHLDELATAISENPAGMDVAVFLPSEAWSLPTVRLGAIGKDVNLVVPVIGQWPIDDLSPPGVVALLRELRNGVSLDLETHVDATSHHASAALALCDAEGTLPDSAFIRENGSCDMEVCIDDDLKPTFWIASAEGGDPDVQLPVDLAKLEGLVGRMLIPCHMYESSGDDWIGVSASDQEGISLVDLKPLDAMERLRLGLAIARLADLGDESGSAR